MATTDFILQGFMARTHATALERILDLPNLDAALFTVAYLNEGGVKLVEHKIAPVAKKVTVFAGIRNDTTSRQGLDRLLSLGVKLYVVDTGSSRLVFHPKIYMTTAPGQARLVIGSANFTAGGLHGNIEGGVALDLDRNNADDEALRKAIADEFAALPGKYPKHVIHITKNSELLALEKEGRLLDESAVEPPHPIAVAKTVSGDKLEKIKLLVTFPMKALTTSTAPSESDQAAESAFRRNANAVSRHRLRACLGKRAIGRARPHHSAGREHAPHGIDESRQGHASRQH